jgi:RNA polymerase primary sigma factor
MAHLNQYINNDRIIRSLFDTAELQGYITIDDLLQVDIAGTAEFEYILDIFEYLGLRGIEIIDEEDGPASLPPKDETDEPGSIYASRLENIAIDDIISLYMREMAIVPLLNAKEEIDLAKRIERASQARRELLRHNGRMKAHHRKKLELFIQDGFRAREYLIKANTRLVVSVARKYMGGGVPFLDLIQEGNLGLMRAVEKYEYRRGFRFSTYATWWIRQSVTRALAYQGRTIRVPVHMIDRLRHMYKVSREFEQKNGRMPTTVELSDHLGIDITKVRWMEQVAQTPISLEKPIGDDDDSEFGMLIEDNSSPGPAEITYQNMLKERVDEVLATLSPREARILRLRYGLGHERPYTLEEVGRKYGLTRERIRQIEGKALRSLRNPHRARMLSEYM